MGKRSFIFSIGLVLSISLRLIPITAQLSAAQQPSAKPNPTTNSKATNDTPKPPTPIAPGDPSPYTGNETRDAAKENSGIQREIRDATIRLAKDTHDLANYTLALVFVGGAIGLIQCFVIYRQLEFTAIAANAAKKSADNAETSIQLAERADVLMERAVLNNPEIPTESRVVLTFKNFGRTRAVNVKFAVRLTVTGTPQGAAGSVKLAALGAGSTQQLAFDPFKKWMTWKQSQDFAAGTIPLRFEGTVTYDDVFGITHKTEPSGVLDPKTNLFTIDRNEAD